MTYGQPRPMLLLVEGEEAVSLKTVALVEAYGACSRFPRPKKKAGRIPTELLAHSEIWVQLKKVVSADPAKSGEEAVGQLLSMAATLSCSRFGTRERAPPRPLPSVCSMHPVWFRLLTSRPWGRSGQIRAWSSPSPPRKRWGRRDPRADPALCLYGQST